LLQQPITRYERTKDVARVESAGGPIGYALFAAPVPTVTGGTLWGWGNSSGPELVLLSELIHYAQSVREEVDL
jgi:hypothetical protein